MALSSARSLKGMMDDGRMPLICCASYTDAEKKAPLSRVPLVKGCCTPRDTCYRPRKGPFRWMDETELRRWNVRVIQSQVDLVLKTLSKSNIFITLGADLVERFYCALLEEPCPLFHRVLLLPVEERTLVQIEASYPTTMGHLDHCLGLSRLEIQLDTRETFLARYSPMLLTRATPLVPEQHQLLLFEHGEGLLPLYKVQLLQNAICRLSLLLDCFTLPLEDKQHPELDTRSRLTPHKQSNMDLGRILSITVSKATEMANLVQRLKWTGMSDELDDLVTNNCCDTDNKSNIFFYPQHIFGQPANADADTDGESSSGGTTDQYD